MTERLEGRPEPGGPVPVIAFDAIDSTNSEALRRAAAGERGPLWLRADRQLAGKGRSGRNWNSPSGNLSATLLFEPGCGPEALHHLSLIAGVAVYDAVAAAFAGEGKSVPQDLRLKWPNDVMIGDAKLSGVLIETSHFGGRTVAAIGCGLNISVSPELDTRPTARLGDFGLTIASAGLLQHLSEAMQKWLACWDRGTGFDAIREAWLKRAGPLGASMSVNAGDGLLTGSFAGLDPDGALLMTDRTGNVRRFHYGDVSFAAGSQDRPDGTE